jgi:hypothetical protein
MALMMMLLPSCSEVDVGRQRQTLESLREDFASYSQKVYGSLATEPLDSTLQTETGLFGGMAVGAGERIVMGRYRYRVDSAEYGPIGRMAFQIRDMDGAYGAVPVVLQFVSRDGSWRLEEVAHFASDTTDIGSAASGSGAGATNPQTNPLVRSLTERLDPWVGAAVDRVSESSD